METKFIDGSLTKDDIHIWVVLQRRYNSVYQQLKVMGFTPLTTYDWDVVLERYQKEEYVDLYDHRHSQMLAQGIRINSSSRLNIS